jgi:hypothetical protein
LKNANLMIKALLTDPKPIKFSDLAPYTTTEVTVPIAVPSTLSPLPGAPMIGLVGSCFHLQSSYETVKSFDFVESIHSLPSTFFPLPSSWALLHEVNRGYNFDKPFHLHTCSAVRLYLCH